MNTSRFYKVIKYSQSEFVVDQLLSCFVNNAKQQPLLSYSSLDIIYQQALILSATNVLNYWWLSFNGVEVCIRI